MLAVAICSASNASAADPWQVKDAPIRFALVLEQTPTHRSAGFFFLLPDGGALPGPFPLTHVMTLDGEELDSYVLWHNQATGAAIVFEPPAAGRAVYVYVKGADGLRLWTPESGLTPSPILCSDPSRASLDAAAQLARFGAVGPRVDYRVTQSHPKAPLCIGGNPSGRPPPCSFYLLAYVVTDDPGRTWIAPLTLRGQTQVSIDGRPVRPQKSTNKWGGTGDWADLNKDLHRVDVLAADNGPTPFSGGRGVLWMTWRPPHATMEELGRKDPGTGSSAWSSRVIRQNEIVRSGSVRVQNATARDGGPVAWATADATHNFWFEGESPVLVYDLSAAAAMNPRDTRYVWSFGKDIETEGRSISWLFQGQKEQTVRLKASSGGRESTRVCSFYAYSPVQTSMEDARARAAFRGACLKLFKTYPPDVDPTATWNDAFWNNLIRNMEVGKSAALLAHLFTVRRDILKEKLSDEQRQVLEDMFVLPASLIDPESALKWITSFKKDADRDREDLLTLKAADVCMYYLNQLDDAREMVKPLARSRGAIAQRARVRLGDIEFLAGNLKEATELYGQVQNEVQRAASAEAKSAKLQALSGGLARSRAELQAQRENRLRPAPRSAAKTVDGWQVDAIREVANSEEVKSLIEEGYYEQAREALDRWELHFPLSKVSGDFMILDAKFFMAIEHYGRARRILEPYCEQVDASSYIPEALEMLVNCMLRMKEDDKVLEAFCEKVKKRLEFHPAAERIDRLLKVFQSGGGEREPTRDTP